MHLRNNPRPCPLADAWIGRRVELDVEGGGLAHKLLEIEGGVRAGHLQIHDK
jgi:hypothetical protein